MLPWMANIVTTARIVEILPPESPDLDLKGMQLGRIGERWDHGETRAHHRARDVIRAQREVLSRPARCTPLGQGSEC